MTIHKGVVVKAQSGFFTVQIQNKELIVCRIPGRLKEDHQRQIDLDPDYPAGDIVAVGDRVEVTIIEDGKGEIELVEERERAFTRRAPLPGGRTAQMGEYVYKQVIIANPDQAVFVFSIMDPEPSLRMLDRFLVMAEEAEIPSIICVNKVDLAIEMGEADYPELMFGMYSKIGYPVIYSSAVQGIGIDELRDVLTGKISVLAGPSGVGKSSLLNAVQPGLGLAVREVSDATGKGKHTTRVRELIPLDGGGHVADTPGLRGMALWDIEPEEMDAYFREIKPLVQECNFSNCSHTHEPGCAVRRAVEEERIDSDRYESYLRLREEAAERPWWY
ncbi:MAG: ribosome small subunit-dependent GTPase A [Anaerolineales bacterium]|nr:ribosome small subunit-dependent GTPase A [Anaerolineales bacterium]